MKYSNLQKIFWTANFAETFSHSTVYVFMSTVYIIFTVRFLEESSIGKW
jgi:hypothetical protein